MIILIFKWHHDMETPFHIMAFVSAMVESLRKGHWRIHFAKGRQLGSFVFSMLQAWTSCWTISRVAFGDDMIVSFTAHVKLPAIGGAMTPTCRHCNGWKTVSQPITWNDFLCGTLRLRSGWSHDDVIKWKHFPLYWPFVRGIHRSLVNSPHKGQWRGALMFSLICAWINGWVNNGEAGDLRRNWAHYGVTVMVLTRHSRPHSIHHDPRDSSVVVTGSLCLGDGSVDRHVPLLHLMSSLSVMFDLCVQKDNMGLIKRTINPCYTRTDKGISYFHRILRYHLYLY